MESSIVTTPRYEPFKDSTRSICQFCSNKAKDCFEASKVCHTDPKAGTSYVERCSKFEGELPKVKKG